MVDILPFGKVQIQLVMMLYEVAHLLVNGTMHRCLDYSESQSESSLTISSTEDISISCKQYYWHFMIIFHVQKDLAIGFLHSNTFQDSLLLIMAFIFYFCLFFHLLLFTH